MALDFFGRLLSISAAMSAVIAVLLLVSGRLDKSFEAKWKYRIWLIIALRLLLITPAISFGRPAVQVSIPNPAMSEIMPSGFIQQGVLPQSDNAGVGITDNNNNIVPHKPIISLGDVAFTIWLIGALGLLAHRLTGHAVFKRRIMRRSGGPKNPETREPLESVKSELGIESQIELLICAENISPMLIGLFKPAIILPGEDYSRDDLYYILKHELCHYTRHDLWYKLVLVAANVVHWFNPVVYLLCEHANADIEKSCDDKVVGGMDSDRRKGYSQAILSSIAGQKESKSTLTTYFYGSKKTLKERFMNILNSGIKRNGVGLLIVALVVILTAGMLVGCSVTANDENTPEPEDSFFSPDPDVVEPEMTAVPEEGNYSGELNALSFTSKGYTIELPELFGGKVTITPEEELPEDCIIEVRQSKTLENYPKAGLLFRIVRNSHSDFEKYWPVMDGIGGSWHFAYDDDWYYSMETPTDVQFDISTAGVMEEYLELAEYGNVICTNIVRANNLTLYDHDMAVNREYTYDGDHAFYEITLSNDAWFKVVLSKPVLQHESGIWCVERMYDSYNNIYIAMPDTELTAAEFYAHEQARADKGNAPELLDAEKVAIKYLDDVWGYSRHIERAELSYS